MADGELSSALSIAISKDPLVMDNVGEAAGLVARAEPDNRTEIGLCPASRIPQANGERASSPQPGGPPWPRGTPGLRPLPAVRGATIEPLRSTHNGLPASAPPQALHAPKPDLAPALEKMGSGQFVRRRSP